MPARAAALPLGHRAAREREVGKVDPHQRLSAANDLSGVNQTLDHLSADPKAQIALHACRNDAGKLACRGIGQA